MRRSARTVYGLLLGGVIGTILAMLYQPASPTLGALALVGLLTLPGLLVLLLIRPERMSRLEYTLYTPALSALVLMASGLATNIWLPRLGNFHPLAADAQVPWMSWLLLGLWGAAAIRNYRTIYRQWPQPSFKALGLGAALLGLPALAAMGAISLNNGGSNLYTMLCYFLIAASAVSLVTWRRKVAPWVWGWAIFAMGLALLWSTSLRGSFITGHDIQLEYYVFRLTDAGKYWTMANLHDAYNACLSITILPTILKSLSGFDGAILYKVVYQILFAISGVGVFALARRYASNVLAFLAAFVFITFPTFFTDMPMLTRQETAFGFFVLLLLTMFNQYLSRQARRALIVLLTVGVVLSHYSTTFVMVALFGGAFALLVPGRIAAAIKAKASHLVLARRSITLGVVLVAALSAFAWTGLYTKTGNNIAAQLAKVSKALPTLLHPTTSSDSAAYSIFKGAQATPQQTLDAYVAAHHQTASATALPAGGFYYNSQNYALVAEDQPLMPLTHLGQWVQTLGIDPGIISTLGKTGYALGLQAAIVLATVFVVVYRRKFNLPPDFVALAPAAVVLVGTQAVLPVIDYGLYRMLQQELVFLALPVVLGLMELLEWVRVRSQQLRLTLIATGFVGAFLVVSGFVPQLLGGAVASLPLDNSGFYYDAYYTDAQDMGTFAWLKVNYPAGYPINSDTFTRMKIMANTGITTVDGLTPTELTRQSYVVLSAANVTSGRVALYYNGQLLFYQYPTDFLNHDKNLIYSTNHTQVYH